MIERPRRGRPRSDDARRSVLEAAAAGIHDGFDQLTLGGIAARAGVGRQTVYRWYGSPAEVVADAVREGVIALRSAHLMDTGDIEHDLLQWLSDFFEALRDPENASVLRATAAAAASSTAQAEALAAAFVTPGRSSLVTRLRSAVEAGQVRPDVDLEVTADLLAGFVVQRTLARADTSAASAGSAVLVLTSGLRP